MREVDLERMFTYSGRGKQRARYESVSQAARELARVILKACPESNEKEKAIRRVRQAMMWAHGTIELTEQGESTRQSKTASGVEEPAEVEACGKGADDDE